MGEPFAERRALETRGQVTIAPVRRAALRITDFRQHNKPWQILVLSAKTVVHPRTDAGVAAKTVAAVHLIHSSRMVHAVHCTAAKEADVIGNFREVQPIFCHVRAALTGFNEPEWTLHIVTFATFHRRLLPAFTQEFPEVQLRQSRLGIERVDLRRTSLHHQEDDVLCPGRQMANSGASGFSFFASSASNAVNATLPSEAPSE